MGSQTVSPQFIIAVCAGASAIASTIFWSAYLLGKYIARLEDVEKTVAQHEADIQELKS
jgi:cytochrome P450